MENYPQDKRDRLLTMARVHRVHLLEAHVFDTVPPLMDTDDDAYVLSCRGCEFAWAIEGSEADEDVRYVLVEQS